MLHLRENVCREMQKFNCWHAIMVNRKECMNKNVFGVNHSPITNLLPSNSKNVKPIVSSDKANSLNTFHKSLNPRAYKLHVV